MGAAGAGLDHKLCALALTIASIPASTWGDLMPKVMIAAFLREDPGSAPSYQAPMLEVAIARDTARLQSHSDGPSLH
ncbi:hypothetical protein P7D22_20105 [Lichenihabitans sp. Uapishka_5]|uniref:hypothetical protein n=1 Tax=Lichenihabitans sp. Uapishka_5 TaxID=3037302 RepID=UPI0029E7E165|nr:hypothetical protein [Lichenihabitans sp. Uapishka_5]MDX7953472.1 hypothetical protein [Lichenihabitans sp. Uapishka_5]